MTKARAESVEAARKNLPSLLEQAHRGKPIVITKRGVPYTAIPATSCG
jgi:prevent-host-death family protein